MFLLFLAMPLSLIAAEDKTKNSSTQQVGGLLFDVDEGVKIEHGPGGSVYLKSNREYMQEKLKTMEEKIDSLDKRLSQVETSLAAFTDKNAKPAGQVSASSAPAPAPADEKNRRVLVT